MVSAVEIERLIEWHNVELSRDPNADPGDLILGDNAVSKTVRMHLGTLTAVVGYGSRGSGKTWTCYKVFHDVKRRALATYVPLNSYRESGRAKLTLNSRGAPSLVATAIAEALVKPRSLSREVPGVLANVSSDVGGFRVDRLLGEVLEDYVKVLGERREYHVVLLDDFDRGVEGVDDIEALVDYLIASRDLYDKYGAVRVTLAVLTSRELPNLGEAYWGKHARDVIYEALKSRRPRDAEHITSLASLDADLDERGNVASVLRDIVLKSVELVNRSYGAGVEIADVEKAVWQLVDVYPSVEWGREVLVKALARATASGSKASLLEHVEQSLKDALGMSSAEEVRKVLVEGRWSYASTDIVSAAREFTERVLKEACRISGCTPQILGERGEPGFTSVFTRAWKAGGRVEDSVHIAFWFRVSNVNDEKTLTKARKVFGGMYVVMVAPENVNTWLLPGNVLGVIRLPNPLFYYMLVAGARTIDPRIERYYRWLKEVKIEESARQLSEILGRILP